MASHRMPESERPRRAVPAWVTAPPEDAGAPAPSSVVPAVVVADRAGADPVTDRTRPGAEAAPVLEARPTAAPPVLDPDAVVPDFPPTPELLPPAPTSPNVDTVPFSALASARAVVAGPGPADGSGVQVAGDRGEAGNADSTRAAGRHGAARVASGDRQDVAAGSGMALPVAPVLGGAHAAHTRSTARAPGTHEVQPATPTSLPTAPHGLLPSGSLPAGSPLPTVGSDQGTAAGATTVGTRAAGSAPAPAMPPAPVLPVVPAPGQPRFSVPGLEHVVVEGVEPEPVGPIGYRTPARFARQQARVVPPAVTAPPTFDAVLASPAQSTAARFPGPAAEAQPVTAPVVPAVTRALPAVTPTQDIATETVASDGAATHLPTPAREHRNAARGRATSSRRPFLPRRPTAPPAKTRSTAVPLAGTTTPEHAPTAAPVSEATTGRPASTARSAARAGRPLGSTPGAVLGALAGLGTLGLAAWWFTATATVHAVGVLLGVIAVVVSSMAMRNPASTWQRPVALLGTVLGAVGALVLLWAAASALGAPLPDLTGTGTTPTIVP
ncbi:hypothetical protein [Curtobacterium sp. MCSS17_015]|uniref:hypothetical protein n=1 Tax=Curtobacterium sp. MCSS17_015 TaxID=2175666 RepID=UPI0011B42BAE|nr:hypothetical protein [Curtobacterium sp. MCSS17_015]WIB27589.1 hypothetical protein DEJ18_05735 [Curtobacterium sp. MCSS17_015]